MTDFDEVALPPSWGRVPVPRGLSRRPFHAGKVQRQEYLSRGEFPVVDQGQGLIAGYCDDDAAVYDGPLPVIVFGDHTRILKLVGFRFVCGADGTKLLVPDPEVFDPEFMFYALSALTLPSRGYNRHFALLKEKVLPSPPLAEQVEIALALRSVQQALDASEQVLFAARELRRSLMRHVFMYGPVPPSDTAEVSLAETAAGRHPDAWTVVPISDLGEVVTGATPSTTHAEYFGGTFPFFTPGDIGRTKWVAHSSRTVTREGLAQVRELKRGAVMVTCIGDIGRLGIADAERSATNQQINAIVPSSMAPEFIYYLISAASDRLKAAARRTTVPILSKGVFLALRVALPPEEDRDDIVGVLSSIDGKIDIEERRRDGLSALFVALLQNLLTGRVRLTGFE